MIKIYAEHLEPKALAQFQKAMSLPCNIQGALMPDAHSGYTLPIGAIIKSDSVVFPSYVGYDIGCGMCAVKTDIPLTSIDLKLLKTAILSTIPIGFAHHLQPQDLPTSVSSLPSTDLTAGLLKNLGPYQLGTLGSGNHFIELGVSSDDLLQIIIHSGSRGLGKQVAEHYMKLAAVESLDKSTFQKMFAEKNGHWRDKNPEGYLKALDKFVRMHMNTIPDAEDHFGLNIHLTSGQNYLTDMHVCLEFALANRKHMIETILVCLQQQIPTFKTTRFINRNHNHAELQGPFVIHRKGATHAEAGMLGVIPGNMKDGSFIVEGKGCPESLCSSSHGAGRVLSRKQAKTTLNYSDFVSSMSDIISNHSEDTLDESPLAYKNIFDVMELQKDLVSIVEHVRPVLNIKG